MQCQTSLYHTHPMGMHFESNSWRWYATQILNYYRQPPTGPSAAGTGGGAAVGAGTGAAVSLELPRFSSSSRKEANSRWVRSAFGCDDRLVER